MPDGYEAGLMSANYPGLLAIVNSELVFDPAGGGGGSRPWMERITAFQIHRNQIMKIELSEKLAMGRKTITIQTYTGDYCFYMADADKIFEIIKK